MAIRLYPCKLAKNILNIVCSILKGNRMCKGIVSMLSVFSVWNDFQDQKTTLRGATPDAYQSLSFMSNILTTWRILKRLSCSL